jgi:hypothetical protein
LATVGILTAGCSGTHPSRADSDSTTSAAKSASQLPTTKRARVPATDVAAIRDAFNALNFAYRRSPAAGRDAQADTNYFDTFSSVFTRAQCLDHWAGFEGGQLRWQQIPIVNSIAPAPKWLPGHGVHPRGHLYVVAVRFTASSPTSPTFTATTVRHVTVLGRFLVMQFIDCAIPTSA